MSKLKGFIRRLLQRSRTRTVLLALVVFSAALGLVVYLLPTAFALALTVAAITAQAALIALVGLDVARKLSRLRPNDAASARGGGRAGALNDHQRSILRNWRARLFGGFSATALRELRPVVRSGSATPAYRLAVAEMIVAWDEEQERRSRPAVPAHYDIVITSHFALPGGTTSANVEEIRAYRKAGLKVGLLHHPVYQWDVSRPVDPKIMEVVDGEQVVLLGLDDAVECDLMIVRFPGCMMKLLDDRPEIAAKRTVLVVNQTPYSYYGPDGGTSLAWDVRTVFDNLTDWIGEHTWYAIGPVVRDALRHHHAEEIERIDIADEFWFESIDVADWQRPGQRERRGGAFRIGRHSRDSRLKWPDTPELVRACYPEGAGYEIRVLGGTAAVREILGRLPDNWVDFEFNSVPAREFLWDVDAMVYFINSEGAEAFGRAPLEAMAVGLPCVMDRRFEELFGGAAIYCAPEEVGAVIDDLASDPARYAEQAERSIRYVKERFSHEAQLARVAKLGVNGLANKIAAA